MKTAACLLTVFAICSLTTNIPMTGVRLISEAQADEKEAVEKDTDTTVNNAKSDAKKRVRRRPADNAANGANEGANDRPMRNGNADKRGRGMMQQRRGGPTQLERIQRMFKMSDKDGDGKISKVEAPARMKDRFERIDRDGDGFIDKAEQAALIKLVSRMAEQRGGLDDQKNGKQTKPNGGKTKKKRGNGRFQLEEIKNVKPIRPPVE